MSKYIFSVKDGKTCLNGVEYLTKGFRCSNALFSEETANDLVRNLETYAAHGLNTVSVFFMGNRFGDIRGYNEDGTLNPVYAERMGRIIEAADRIGMVVMVGCLYWGESKAKYDHWTQKEVNAAVENTVQWLKDHDYRNVFVNVDNEGMGRREKGFDNRELVLAAKAVDPTIMVATNYVGIPPEEADLCVHFSDKAPGKPYIESEGTPWNTPGAYWGRFNRKADPNNWYRTTKYWNYLNIGIYTEDMKENQKEVTRMHLDNGLGYMLASTWFQAVPPYGPNHDPGGYGSEKDPGVQWWLDFMRDTYGPYTPPCCK